MKYYLFAGEYYYPLGGAKDLKGVFASLKDAKNNFFSTKNLSNYYEWAHIMNSEGKNIWNNFDD